MRSFELLILSASAHLTLVIHKVKKTQNYLAVLSEGRYKFVFTTTHGSWLKMIEGKMTKYMLCGI